jgi:hypothetical protein
MCETTGQATYIACHTPGLAGTTPVRIKKTADGYEARCGIALFGSTNMTDEQFEACNSDPFHVDFRDNYCSGNGATEEEAIGALEQDFKEMHESIWRV